MRRRTAAPDPARHAHPTDMTGSSCDQRRIERRPVLHHQLQQRRRGFVRELAQRLLLALARFDLLGDRPFGRADDVLDAGVAGLDGFRGIDAERDVAGGGSPDAAPPPASRRPGSGAGPLWTLMKSTGGFAGNRRRAAHRPGRNHDPVGHSGLVAVDEWSGPEHAQPAIAPLSKRWRRSPRARRRSRP